MRLYVPNIGLRKILEVVYPGKITFLSYTEFTSDCHRNYVSTVFDDSLTIKNYNEIVLDLEGWDKLSKLLNEDCKSDDADRDLLRTLTYNLIYHCVGSIDHPMRRESYYMHIGLSMVPTRRDIMLGGLRGLGHFGVYVAMTMPTITDEEEILIDALTNAGTDVVSADVLTYRIDNNSELKVIRC